MQRLAETSPRSSVLATAGFAAPNDLSVVRPDATRFADFKVIRRNGSVVSFEPGKIAIAMTKAFLAVNGGHGAASARVRELVEQMTWSQLGRHTKPILMLDTKAFWKPFLVLIEHMREAGFIRPGLEIRYLVAEKPEDVVPMLLESARRFGVQAGVPALGERM